MFANILVLENTQFRFSAHSALGSEARSNPTCPSEHATVSSRKNCPICMWTAELGLEPVEVMYSVLHPRTIYGQGVGMSSRILCCVFVGYVCPLYLESVRVWERGRIGYFVTTPENRELDNIYGEPFVLEWKIFPGHTTTQPVQEIQNFIETELQIRPQIFEDRIKVVYVHDIEKTAKDNTGRYLENSSRPSDYAKKFPLGHWSFFRSGDEARFRTRRRMESYRGANDVVLRNFFFWGKRSCEK